MSDERTVVVERAEQLWQPSTRRAFLKALGVGGVIVLMPGLFAACSDDDDITRPGDGGSVTLDLSNDIGILNYAYALEQLEAAFYTAAVASTAFSAMTTGQQEVLTDLRNHEVAHRELLAAVLGSARIGSLALDSAAVVTAIASTSSILENAEAFEDLGVSAYNGAGKYLQSADNLLLAGKIASVEARHAAAIRDLREGLGLSGTPPNTRFAGDDVVTDGLDAELEPADVLTGVAATGFVQTQIGIGRNPTVGDIDSDDSGVIEFALKLEMFENEFYKAVLGTSASADQNAAFAAVRAQIPAAALTAVQQIQKHEQQHVDLLIAAGAVNSLDLTADSFDFTGGGGTGTGPFARATSELAFLLALAQGVEDVGVRAYEGQLTQLIDNKMTLEAALRIHSVEARHASKIRRLRRSAGAPTAVKYSGTISGGGAAAAGVDNISPAPPEGAMVLFSLIYDGEENVTQVKKVVTSLPNLPSGFGAPAASEAFDEPLTQDQVVAIVQPFFKTALS
jgi:rubrerythrin